MPCPNPRLASEDTSLRMLSIGVEVSSRLGSDNPSSSHRIFGLYDGLTFFLLGLPPLHPPEIFMCDSFCLSRLRLAQRSCDRASRGSSQCWNRIPPPAWRHTKTQARRSRMSSLYYGIGRAGTVTGSGNARRMKTRLVRGRIVSCGFVEGK